MMNFFDKLGKLGEILAPVTGSSHPFFTAIQHHDNVEVQNLLLNSHHTDMARTNENGYAAIHCACRFNNMFAVDLIMSRGVVIDFPDLQGNTPLHYAAKYDHLDLCRILIERGAFAGRKNDQGQSAYDISKCHIVRQYLLPLQFQSERQHIGGAGLFNGLDNGHMSSSSNYLMTVQSPLSGAEYDSEQPTANGESLWQQSQPYNIPAPIYNHTRALVHHSSYNTLVPMSSSATASPYQQSQSQSPTLHGGGITNIKPHLITRYNTTSPIGDTNNNKFTDNRMVIPIIVSTPNSCGTESPMEPYSINSSNSHTQGQGICNSSPVSISCHNGPTARNNNPPTFASSPIQSYRPPATLNSNMSLSQSRISSPSAPITPCSPPHPFNNNNNNNSNSGRQTSQNMSQTVHQSISPIVHVNSRQGLGPCASDLRLVQGQGPPQAVTTGTGTGYRPTVQTNYTYSGGSNRIIQPDGFHTSASDPALQKKYGHTKNIIDTAPPPIFNMVISNGYGNGNGGGLPPQNGMYAPQVYIQQEITPSGHPKYSSAGHNHQ